MLLPDDPAQLEIYDVSVPLYAGMPVYPGDPPVTMAPRSALNAGGDYNLLNLDLGTHTGTHLDAPRHFLPGAPTVDQVSWEALLGPARLVQVPPGQALDTSLLEGLDLSGVRRLLLRTRPPGQQADADFAAGWPTLTPEAAARLAAAGLLLLGLDTPSADSYRAPRHPVHHTLLEAGAVILEELDLSVPPAGDYTLVCLPLRIRDGDGAPCRVLLLREARA